MTSQNKDSSYNSTALAMKRLIFLCFPIPPVNQDGKQKEQQVIRVRKKGGCKKDIDSRIFENVKIC